MIRNEHALLLYLLNALKGVSTGSWSSQEALKTGMANAKSVEEMLLKAGAKTGKELSSLPLH